MAASRETLKSNGQVIRDLVTNPWLGVIACAALIAASRLYGGYAGGFGRYLLETGSLIAGMLTGKGLAWGAYRAARPAAAQPPLWLINAAAIFGAVLVICCGWLGTRLPLVWTGWGGLAIVLFPTRRTGRDFEENWGRAHRAAVLETTFDDEPASPLR